MSVAGRCEDIMGRFLDAVLAKDGPPTCEEARLALDIRAVAVKTELVKLGDCKAGLHPSKKAYDKVTSFLNEDHGFGPKILVWDDLVEADSIEGSGAELASEVIKR